MVQGAGLNGMFLWNDKDGGGGFGASEELQSIHFGSFDSSRDGACGFKRSEGANKRIKLTESNQQEGEAKTFEGQSPLGLTLSKTPSFVNLLEMMLSQGRKTNCLAETNHCSDLGGVRGKVNDFVSQPMSEKLKASNFSASLLKIGSWERATRYEGDLVAKCYYAKRKLVWEVLERGLKKKIETQWSDILAIRAIIKENEPGILEIELNQPPSFFQETNPQPRKHTLWQLTSDFTGGQAPTVRRHYLRFPPGALDKHYEKLLQCDERLFMLSKRPFPSLESPYFHSNFYGCPEFSCNLNGGVAEIPHGLQFPLPSIPTPSLLPSYHVQSFEQTHKPALSIKDSTSPMSVMEFSPIDENVSKHGFENLNTEFWNHSIINNAIMGREDQIQELLCIASSTQVSPALANQGYPQLIYGEETGRPKQCSKTLSEIEKHLLSDSQVVCSDEGTLLKRVSSMCSLLPKKERVKPANVTATNHIRQGRAPDEYLVMSSAHHSNGQRGLVYPQPIQWVPPRRVSNENLLMHLPRDNSLYPYEFSAPTMEDFSSVDILNDANYWT